MVLTPYDILCSAPSVLGYAIAIQLPIQHKLNVKILLRVNQLPCIKSECCVRIAIDYLFTNIYLLCKAPNNICTAMKIWYHQILNSSANSCYIAFKTQCHFSHCVVFVAQVSGVWCSCFPMCLYLSCYHSPTFSRSLRDFRVTERLVNYFLMYLLLKRNTHLRLF